MNSSSNRFASSVLSVVATAGLVAMASPARAASIDADASRQAVIRVGDLDLAGASGRATFERRLTAAAQQVCDTQLSGVAGIDKKCTDRVVTEARRDAGLDQTVDNG